MRPYRFSPFNKELSAVSGADLLILKDVTEGWFVDYKSQPLTARDFGKHISAFANQYGGFLFVGIEEGPHKSMKAETFAGIPLGDVAQIMVKIRDGVAAHVTPECYFEHIVIEGPVPEVGLAHGRAIIAIGVPEGMNPPYVHSSGKIYRRVGDSSEPKAETDRALLEQMWRKSEKNQEGLRKFIWETPPPFSRSGALALSYVYFICDPYWIAEPLKISMSEFRRIMGGKESPSGISFSLENIFSTFNGLIARQVERNNPLDDLATFQWSASGNVRLTIPISRLPQPSIFPAADLLLAEFYSALPATKDHYLHLADFTKWLAVLVSLTDKFHQLRDSFGLKGAFYGKLRFAGLLRLTPFLNLKSYLDHIAQCGLPVLQHDEILIPPGDNFDALFELADNVGAEPHLRSLLTVLPLALWAFRSIGVPLMTPDPTDPANIAQIYNEVTRAMFQAISPKVRP